MTWAKLKTAYGPATGLDKTLAKLGSTSADQRSRALLELEGCVAHQATIYSASAPAFTAILAHLVAPKTGDRPAIAALLAKIAWGDGDAKSKASVAAAVKAARPALVALLDDPDPAVRAAGAPLVGRLCVLVPAVLDVAVAHLATETDPATLCALARMPAGIARTTPAWQRACTSLLAKPGTQLAGAIALVAGLEAKAPKAAVAALVAALGQPGDDEVPRLLASIGPRRGAEVVPDLIAAFDVTGDLAFARAALGLVIGKRKRGAAKPTPAQRDVLRWLLRSDAAWRAGAGRMLHEHGLPDGRNALAQLLGEPTTLVLDRRHGRQAIWELAKPWFKRKRSAAALLAELALPPVDALRLLDELYEGEHRFSVAYDDDADLDGAWAAQVAALPRTAVATLADVIDEPGRDGSSRSRMLGAFLALGGVLDPALDPLIPVGHFDSAVHPHVPPARLEPRIYAHLCADARARGEPATGHWGIGFAGPSETAAKFLAVCPTPRLARLVLGLAGLSGIWGDCETEVAKHATHPAVAAALKAFRARVARVNSYGVMRKKVADWVADAL